MTKTQHRLYAIIMLTSEHFFNNHHGTAVTMTTDILGLSWMLTDI